ncbi:MAG: carboxypeptidase regulatory-like domain-containing protein [bacterium]|nr:carboxypeptidase regulatory-like domain-containing protein [bacterium]
MKIATVISRIAVWTAFLTVSAGVAVSSTTVKELWELAASGERLTAEQKAELAPFEREFEQRGNETIDAVGGPDNYGYYYVDNQNGDTASYNWIELRGDNLAQWVDFSSADDATAALQLSFGFPFYGISYPIVLVCTNGFITFADDRVSSLNQCLPTASLGGPALCAFWDDLHLHHDGNQVNNNTVAWRDFGDYAVIQFDQIGHYGFPDSPDDRYTFEVLLYANGSIKLQYQDMLYSEYTGSQTIGLQQNNGGTSLQYTCNGGSPAGGHAVWFYRSGYGALGGVVTTNGQPLYQATVHIEGTDLYTSADGNGFFYFPAAPVGSYSLTARSFGCVEQTVPNVVVANNQTTTQNISVTSIPVQDFEWASEPMAIPDRDTVYAEVYVDDNYTIGTMAVQIGNLTHSYVGDLVLWLESPWGQRALLSERNGGSGDNMMGCQMDDQAGMSIASGVAPFTNRYLPEQALGLFTGEPSRGTWKLVMYDAANQDQGQLVDWTLRLTGVEIPEGLLQGFVTDSEETPIPNARVYFAPTNQAVWTGANGYYTMWLPVGQWNIEYSADGYCTQTVENLMFNNNSEVEYDAMLGAPEGLTTTTLISMEVLGSGIYTYDFVLSSSGACPWEYTVDVIADEWLSVSPAAGEIPVGFTELLTVTFNTNGLAAGVYTGELEISHNGLTGRITIPVILDLALSNTPTSAMPEAYALRGNYPNPFNGQTEIAFDLPSAGPVTMTVHNLLGQQVATVLDGTRAAGFHTVNWQARSANGTDLTTGLYFLRMTASGHEFVSKMILTR